MKKRLVLLIAALATLYPAPVFAEAARRFPVPDTVSPQMAQSVKAPAPLLWSSKPENPDEWRALTEEAFKAGEKSAKALADRLKLSVKKEVIAGVPVYIITPPQIDEDKKDKILYFIHGGGYVLGAGMSGTPEGLLMAHYNHYRVAAVDYRMAPDFPFPAAIEDAFAAYKAIAEKYGAQNIAVFGTSTGGAMTLILALQALKAGAPLPKALISGTPWADLGKTGDSYFTNDGVDNVLGTYDHLLKAAAETYAAGEDFKNPLLSPVYADGSALGRFPPTLLVSGTRDLFLSNTVRMHLRLLENGAEASLIVYEALSHAQYYLDADAPETAVHYRLLGGFLAKHLLNETNENAK